MARIVDIRRFVKQYPFLPQTAECQLTFTVHDPMLEWNQGKFKLKVDEKGRGQLTEGSGNPETAFDIQTLTTMLMGYKRPTYLARAGRFQARRATVELLEKLIERQTPYFSDYF